MFHRDERLVEKQIAEVSREAGSVRSSLAGDVFTETAQIWIDAALIVQRSLRLLLRHRSHPLPGLPP